MRVVCIIQVRAGSTRLPNKAFLPLAGKSMTQNIIERVRRATKLDYVVLAFPLKDAESFIPVLLSQHNTSGVAFGSYASQDDENDLVARHLHAAQSYNADIIVRVPGDNPCIEPEYIDLAVQLALSEPCPFYTCTTAGFREVFVDGIGAEVYTLSTLQWLNEFSKEREHPHKYFDRYAEYRLPPAHVRLDVNTQADYDFIADIYSHFGHNRFTVEEVLGYLDSKKVLVE